eukprot:gene27973-33177_t
MLLPLLPVLAATGSPTIVDKDNIIADCTNVTDCTAELQAAFDTCARIVTVPALIGRSWIVRPLEITCDGQTVDFATDAVLQAKRGEYHIGAG